MSVQVVGVRNPIVAMSATIQGTNTTLTRTPDNFFTIQGQGNVAIPFPLTVTATDIYGQKLTEQIPNRTNDVLINGSKAVQFAQH